MCKLYIGLLLCGFLPFACLYLPFFLNFTPVKEKMKFLFVVYDTGRSKKPDHTRMVGRG